LKLRNRDTEVTAVTTPRCPWQIKRLLSYKQSLVIEQVPVNKYREPLQATASFVKSQHVRLQHARARLAPIAVH